MENPWKHKNTFAIGGLEEIGFATKSDFALVLSGQGEGIFDCKSGKLIDRRNNEYEWWQRYDQNENEISGFGIIEKQKIKTSGLINSDSLSKSTSDFWTLEKELNGDSTKIKLMWRGSFLIEIGEDGPCELRAYGFSETENSLVFATSCELIIFSRDMENS